MSTPVPLQRFAAGLFVLLAVAGGAESAPTTISDGSSNTIAVGETPAAGSATQTGVKSGSSAPVAGAASSGLVTGKGGCGGKPGCALSAAPVTDVGAPAGSGNPAAVAPGSTPMRDGSSNTFQAGSGSPPGRIGGRSSMRDGSSNTVQVGEGAPAGTGSAPGCSCPCSCACSDAGAPPSTGAVQDGSSNTVLLGEPR
ncbi:MAG: hypothetical protein Q8Q73_12495 [Stagnimonas sp.]|nr:hypothetical protein [Stagnimonas sp.]